MRARQQSSTTYPIPFRLVDSSNNALTGLTPTVTLSKNGGSFGSATGTVAEVGNGLYKLTPSTADVGTLGPLVVRATGTNAVEYMAEYSVVAYDPFANPLDAESIESGKTHRQALRAIASTLAGDKTGEGTASVAFKAIGNSGTTRVTGALDDDGNRTVTLNL